MTSFTKKQLLGFYEKMFLIRKFEEKANDMKKFNKKATDTVVNYENIDYANSLEFSI